MTNKSRVVDDIAEDLIDYVVEFLTPSDLLSAMQVNGYWKSVCEKDHIWRRFSTRRWNLEVSREMLKACETEDYRELYYYFDRNRLMPRGKYTLKHQLVWGKNRHDGVDVWMTIAHRPDCRILTRRSRSYIQLRLVIQNAMDLPVTVDFRQMRVHLKNGKEGRILSQDLAPRVIAFNGEERQAMLLNSTLHLQLFDFAVVSVNVECEGCEFESDFLEECRALWVPIQRPGPCKSLSTCRCGLIPDHYHHGGVRVPVVDESVIWKHYQSISGRFMVLDARLPLSKYPFATCSHTRSPKVQRKVTIA